MICEAGVMQEANLFGVRAAEWLSRVSRWESESFRIARRSSHIKSQLKIVEPTNRTHASALVEPLRASFTFATLRLNRSIWKLHKPFRCAISCPCKESRSNALPIHRRSRCAEQEDARLCSIKNWVSNGVSSKHSIRPFNHHRVERRFNFTACNVVVNISGTIKERITDISSHLVDQLGERECVALRRCGTRRVSMRK
jgi:hypothetical protein